MTMLQFPALAILVLCAAVAILTGQPAAAQPAPETTSDATQAAQQRPITTDPDTGDANDGDHAAAPAAPDNSPFDYQASEQISEDLSVSFPVDI